MNCWLQGFHFKPKCCNAHTAVDEAHQIIDASQVEGRANDRGLMLLLLNEVSDILGEAEREVMFADAGYCNEADSVATEQRGIGDPIAFGREGELPDFLEPGPVEAVQEVLSGLVKVVVMAEDLKAALLAGGFLASPAEIKARFEGYLDGLAKGEEPAKVRVVLE